MEKQLFIAIRSEDGKWLVQETKFAREAGDRLVINNKPYIVVTTGSEEECSLTMQESIRQNNKLWKAGLKPVYNDAGRQEREAL